MSQFSLPYFYINLYVYKAILYDIKVWKLDFYYGFDFCLLPYSESCHIKCEPPQSKESFKDLAANKIIGEANFTPAKGKFCH